MAMDQDTAFAVIQRALEAFDATVGHARTAHAESEQTIAAVEYEIEQLKKLVAEHALPVDAPVEAPVSAIEVAGENVGSGLLRRLVRAA
jgi:hypothetical protein